MMDGMNNGWGMDYGYGWIIGIIFCVVVIWLIVKFVNQNSSSNNK
jgi:hypothetical protein